MKKSTQIRLDALRDAVSKREIIRREGLHGGDIKEGIDPFAATRLPDERGAFQAKDWPLS